ncbi:NAD-specific glutamate dehydrogenase [compost metagenome]
MGLANGEAIRQLLAQQLDVLQATPHEALDREDGVQRVAGGGLPGAMADLDTIGVVAHSGRQDDLAVGIRQGFGNAAAHGGDQRIGGTQVDTHRQAALVRLGALPGFSDLQ